MPARATAAHGVAQLSYDECVNLVLTALAGGMDTAQSQLAQGIRLFADHPGQWARLRDRPELAGPDQLRSKAISSSIAVLPMLASGLLLIGGWML
ncbi:hypothetical protein [Nocardia sp. NPDC050175]|uniref:hypothetical protein n=1 Tax=Nocardia sp. NPDC050175 TaxID=3364317 RepID=UPI0037B5C083